MFGDHFRHFCRRFFIFGHFLDNDVKFPNECLERLDEMLSRARWIVPVLPEQELQTLLRASISLCTKGLNKSRNRKFVVFFFFIKCVSFFRIRRRKRILSEIHARKFSRLFYEVNGRRRRKRMEARNTSEKKMFLRKISSNIFM